MSLASAIRAAVECQGVSWNGRVRVGSPEWLAQGLADALALVPDMGNDKNCVAAIIGECAQETDWFCSLVEYGGANTRYAPYYGRGCIQCTWESNYQACGDWAGGKGYSTSGQEMVNNPDKMATMPYAWVSAIWYFATRIAARYWQTQDWNAISGLINAGSASYYVSAYELRSKSIRAALAQLGDYEGVDDMPSAEEVARAVWAHQMTIRGDKPKNKGKQVSAGTIMEWLDDQFCWVPANVWNHTVNRAGLPADDPRNGKPVSVGTIMAYQDAFVSDIKQAVIGAVEGIAGADVAERVAAAVDEKLQSFIDATEVEEGSIAAKEPDPDWHIVQRGETLKSIAEAHGKTVQELAELNGMSAPQTNQIYIGDKVRVA